jgi:hypothetical protein
VERHLLFVDIDGVLNPYGGECPDGFTEHWLFPDDQEPVRVRQLHGAWLHELAEFYDLAWGSSWTVEDRVTLGAVLELPSFVAAVKLPTGRFDPALKVPAVDLVAGDRPLAWIDDMLTDEAEQWARTRSTPTLLVPINPSTGLEREHVDVLIDWANPANRHSTTH